MLQTLLVLLKKAPKQVCFIDESARNRRVSGQEAAGAGDNVQQVRAGHDGLQRVHRRQSLPRQHHPDTGGKSIIYSANNSEPRQLLAVLEDCNAFSVESVEKVIKPALVDNTVAPRTIDDRVIYHRLCPWLASRARSTLASRRCTRWRRRPSRCGAGIACKLPTAAGHGSRGRDLCAAAVRAQRAVLECLHAFAARME